MIASKMREKNNSWKHGIRRKCFWETSKRAENYLIEKEPWTIWERKVINEAEGPEKVGERLAIATGAALLIGHVERRKECLQSRKFRGFCNQNGRHFPSNDFQFLCARGS